RSNSFRMERSFGTSGSQESKLRLNETERFGRRSYRAYFEFDNVAPAFHPLFEQSSVIALHHLIAALEVFRHPARHVSQFLRRESSLIAKSPVNRNRILERQIGRAHV